MLCSQTKGHNYRHPILHHYFNLHAFSENDETEGNKISKGQILYNDESQRTKAQICDYEEFKS